MSKYYQKCLSFSVLSKLLGVLVWERVFCVDGVSFVCVNGVGFTEFCWKSLSFAENLRISLSSGENLRISQNFSEFDWIWLYLAVFDWIWLYLTVFDCTGCVSVPGPDCVSVPGPGCVGVGGGCSVGVGGGCSGSGAVVVPGQWSQYPNTTTTSPYHPLPGYYHPLYSALLGAYTAVNTVSHGLSLVHWAPFGNNGHPVKHARFWPLINTKNHQKHEK